MKREILLLILFVLIIPSVLSLDINLKEKYQSGETLLANISGNIENIDSSQISFYRGHVQVPIFYDVAKIKKIYYIYALIPIKEQNYTIKIKDVNYKDSEGEKQEDLTANFSVSAYKADFSINPGFLVTDKDFFIITKNNLDNEIEIESSFLNKTQTIILLPASSKKIYFNIGDAKGIKFLTFKSQNTFYKIPIYILGKSEKPEEESEEKPTIKEKKLTFSSNHISASVNTTCPLFFSLDLFNPTQDTISNITFDYSDEFRDLISIMPDRINNIKAGESVKLNFVFSSSNVGEYEGSLKAISENEEVGNFVLSVSVKEDAVLNTSISLEEPKRCSDIDGKICGPDEKCSIKTIPTLDGPCCPQNGKCEKKVQKKSSKVLFLTLIFLVILIVLYFIWVQMKKRKKFADEILKKRTRKYEKRFEPKNREIRDSLET